MADIESCSVFIYHDLLEEANAGPSVIQVRTQDVTPEAIGSLVLTALEKHGEHSIEGLCWLSNGKLHVCESCRLKRLTRGICDKRETGDAESKQERRHAQGVSR